MEFCAGVHSPKVGWTWPSTRPGITVIPPAESTASGAGWLLPIPVMTPSSTTTVVSRIGDFELSPCTSRPMSSINRVVTRGSFSPFWIHYPIIGCTCTVPAHQQSRAEHDEDDDHRTGEVHRQPHT